MTRKFASIALIFLLLAGCASTEDSAPDTTEKAAANTSVPDQSSLPPEQRVATGRKVAAKPAPAAESENVAAVTFGRGIASADGLDVTFMHNITRYKDGTADGEFKQSASAKGGLIDIDADVTCAELDSKSGKGWIGGTVKRNQSTDPKFMSDVGTEVWIRILDRGAEEQTAYITAPVFKQKGITTAEKFCNKKPWSDADLLQVKTGALAIFP